MQEPILLTVEQAAERLAIKRTHLYWLLLSGKLPSVKIGKSRRIPVSAIEEFVDGLLREQVEDLSNGA
ncbi:MAG TPA: helix-turn-helix domain-containing protein [Dehalococcoidia bacterium]|nr:helix-turn-helix domain-containing protein [Dehalococcoidia bacterium]